MPTEPAETDTGKTENAGRPITIPLTFKVKQTFPKEDIQDQMSFFCKVYQICQKNKKMAILYKWKHMVFTLFCLASNSKF